MNPAAISTSTTPSNMDSACIRHTDLPGTSKLFADLCYDFPRVAPFYKYDPSQLSSLEASAHEAASATVYPPERRAAMAQALAAQNPPSDILTRFAQPGTVAVITGQQVGLFTGPAYTIYKALTAVRLADELTMRGISAVPIFWLATEDHDFAEVANTWVFDANRHPVQLSVAAEPNWQNVQRPAGTYPIEPAPSLAELHSALAQFPFVTEVLALADEAYASDDTLTMGSGFRALLLKLLQRIGILVLDPLDPAVRAIGAPFMAQALKLAPELKTALLARGRELSAAGYHSQVLVEDKTSLFFLLNRSASGIVDRVTLRQKDSEFAELIPRAADVSPNALLRPVWQDYLLPTAAYVGGPGELAYFAQSSVLYDRLLGRMPVITPRAGFTILDARAEKLMKRFQLTLADLMVHRDTLKARIAHTLVPSRLTESFDATGMLITSELDRLSAELQAFDPTLAAAMAKSRAKVGYQIEKLRRKTERETLHRDQRALTDTAYLQGLLYPEGHLQERLHSILPFLALYGLDLIGRLYQQIKPGCPDHQILTL
ncbi:MAG: bacillithiol biosynthesis cysteine-adding enzyme BshC [Acidobacteriota bacterium]